MLWTEDPRLVQVYDVECAGRADHDFYLALAAELGARTVTDLGCGTGVLACDLAARGHDVIGVDPSEAMLDAARHRPGGDRVVWVRGDAEVLTDDQDLLVMTGHVAQYLVTDSAWDATLQRIRQSLAVDGHVAFEMRNPAARAWERWTEEATRATYEHPLGGTFTSWGQVVDVVGDTADIDDPACCPTVTTVGHTLLPDGQHLVATETLRFRTLERLHTSLRLAGLEVVQVWGDWDRSPVTRTSPELIVLAGPDLID